MLNDPFSRYGVGRFVSQKVIWYITSCAKPKALNLLLSNA